MSTLLSRFKSSAKTIVVVVGIAVIPLIYSGALIWANQDPTHNLDHVPAAVVNLDRPASLDGETLELGATLTEELTSSDSDNNFDWTQMSAKSAAAKLDAGDVLAVLTIPENFSASAVSVGDAEPMNASTAHLSIRTNDGANMVSGTIASTIGSTVRTSLASELSDEYLQNIYVGFTTVHDKVEEAADGADALTEGTVTAENGAGELVFGLNELASGSALLADGSATLASGAAAASQGADSLADGLGILEEKTAALPGQAAQLATGAQNASTGASALSDSLTQLAAGAASVGTGTSSALSGATLLQGGLTSLSEQTPALSADSAALATGMNSFVATHSGLTEEDRGTLQQLAKDAASLAARANATDTSIQSLSAGSDELVGSAPAGTGLAALNSGAVNVANGATKAAAGATTLSEGAGVLATGASTFSLGIPQLVSTISAAASGAVSLSEGTTELAAGASTLSTKTGALAVGSLKAADGGEQLNAGLAELEAGETTLSGGLRSGLEDIPSYTEEQSEHLSGVTSEPVAVDNERENEVPAYGYGLAPYFLALALWVGALAFYLMMQPLSRRAVAGRGSAVSVALRSYLPGLAMGIAQSTLAVLVLTRGLGVEPSNVWGLFGMMTLTSLTFVAINQALVALLGAPGRFLGLMMIVLQLSAAGGTYPIQTAPSFFQTIHAWLPLTYSVESFRSLIAGGDIGIAQGIWVLLAWAGGALLVTTLAAFLARRGLNEVTQSSREPIPEPASEDSAEEGEASRSFGDTQSDEQVDDGELHVGQKKQPARSEVSI